MQKSRRIHQFAHVHRCAATAQVAQHSHVILASRLVHDRGSVLRQTESACRRQATPGTRSHPENGTSHATPSFTDLVARVDIGAVLAEIAHHRQPRLLRAACDWYKFGSALGNHVNCNCAHRKQKGTNFIKTTAFLPQRWHRTAADAGSSTKAKIDNFDHSLKPLQSYPASAK